MPSTLKSPGRPGDRPFTVTLHGARLKATPKYLILIFAQTCGRLQRINIGAKSKAAAARPGDRRQRAATALAT